MKTITEDDMSDIFESYLNKVCEVDTGGSIPLYGLLLRTSSKYIALQRRDGRIITISRAMIRSICPTRTQFAPVNGWDEA